MKWKWCGFGENFVSVDLILNLLLFKVQNKTKRGTHIWIQNGTHGKVAELNNHIAQMANNDCDLWLIAQVD